MYVCTYYICANKYAINYIHTYTVAVTKCSKA